MTNEELKAKIESVKSFEDAYTLACEGGYRGTAEEFAALVQNAADEIVPMNLDAMDNVAGGGLGDTLADGWDAVTNACSTAVNWVKENPALTAEIAGGVALVGVAIGTTVMAYRSRNHSQTPKDEPLKVCMADFSFGGELAGYAAGDMETPMG